MAKVLIVEDDREIRKALVLALTGLGHEVSSVEAGLDGLHEAVDAAPDVVVLDLGLPDVGGMDILKMLRAVSNVPVIVATADDDEKQIVRALELGADDYVVKPFSPEQIDARIRAMMRRDSGATDPKIEIGGLVIDRKGHEATLDGRLLELRPKEFQILAYLAERAGEVVSKPEMLAEIWRRPWSDADKTVDVHLSWLRRKLGETAQDPKYLRAVRGVGVKLVDPRS